MCDAQVNSSKVDACMTGIGIVYLCLLLAWLPGHLFDQVLAAFMSCHPLPNVRLNSSADNCQSLKTLAIKLR